MQRIAYKKFKAGEKSTMTPEKALQLTEAGFCFDASEKMGGARRKPAPEVDSPRLENASLEESTVDIC